MTSAIKTALFLCAAIVATVSSLGVPTPAQGARAILTYSFTNNTGRGVDDLEIYFAGGAVLVTGTTLPLGCTGRTVQVTGQVVKITYTPKNCVRANATVQVRVKEGDMPGLPSPGSWTWTKNGSPVPTVRPGVGGISRDPSAGVSPLDSPPASGPDGGLLAILSGGAAGAFALGGAAWYARRGRQQ